MTNKHLGLTALTILLASTDCKNDEVVIAPAAVSSQLAKAFCQRQFNCCTLSELAEGSEGRYTTEEECVPYAQLSIDRQMALLSNELDAGRITIDPAAFDTCVSDYAGACNGASALGLAVGGLPDVARIFAACPGLLVGHVPQGSRCELPEQCEKGSRCTAQAANATTGIGGAAGSTLPPDLGGTSGGSIGICVATHAVGEACNDNADCDASASLYCRQPQFVCTPGAGAGEPCLPQGFGLGVILCGAGLQCDPVRLRCGRMPRAGEPCANSFPACDPDPALGLSCNPFTGACMAPATEGQACGGAALPQCRADLACKATQSDGIGVCGAPPQAGEPCVDRCLGPALCDPNTAICRVPGSTPIGAPCTSNDQCATLACGSVLGTPGSVCVASGRQLVCNGSGVNAGGGKFPMTGVGGSTATGIGGVSGAAGGPFTGTAGAGGAMTGRAGATGGGGLPDPGGAGTPGTGAGGMGGGAAGATGAGGTT